MLSEDNRSSSDSLRAQINVEQRSLRVNNVACHCYSSAFGSICFGVLSHTQVGTISHLPAHRQKRIGRTLFEHGSLSTELVGFVQTPTKTGSFHFTLFVLVDSTQCSILFDRKICWPNKATHKNSFDERRPTNSHWPRSTSFQRRETFFDQ